MTVYRCLQITTDHYSGYAMLCQGLAKENKALRDSASALDEVLDQAGSILGNLVWTPETEALPIKISRNR